MTQPDALQHIYDTMWAHTISRLAANDVECDPFLLDRAHDTRWGMGLIAYIPEPARSRILEFIEAARTLEPEQYYYHPQELHTTILSLFTCSPDFKLTRLALPAYIDLIEQAVADLPPIPITFQGITASPAGALIQGFPDSDALDLLRERLRGVFKQSALEHTIDQRYAIQTAHATVIRFKIPLNQPRRFVKFLETYRAYMFGKVEISVVELSLHDWYLSHEMAQVLATFRLSGTR